jgi:hypothetical protein
MLMFTQLHKVYPDAVIRPPPVKDHGYVNAGAAPKSPISAGYYGPGDSNESLPMSPIGGSVSPSVRLGREKNRLTLRAYLRSLISTSVTAHSPVLLSFLLSGPTTLSQNEVEDAQRREEADRTREDGRKKFAKEIASRVDGLREAVQGVKGDLMGKGRKFFPLHHRSPGSGFYPRRSHENLCDDQGHAGHKAASIELPGCDRVGEDVVRPTPFPRYHGAAD